MRIIKEKTLIEIVENNKYSAAAESIKAWIFEVRQSAWENSGQLKTKYRNASIIGDKRVIFNIKGNDYRLIVDIEYKLKIVFIVWFGAHSEYDKLDVKTVRYEK
jgi:mRNA interferase HigB